jgi:metal-sulfur cluster biosynthetic enzyme
MVRGSTGMRFSIQERLKMIIQMEPYKFASRPQEYWPMVSKVFLDGERREYVYGEPIGKYRVTLDCKVGDIVRMGIIHKVKMDGFESYYFKVTGVEKDGCAIVNWIPHKEVEQELILARIAKEVQEDFKKKKAKEARMIRRYKAMTYVDSEGKRSWLTIGTASQKSDEMLFMQLTQLPVNGFVALKMMKTQENTQSQNPDNQETEIKTTLEAL